MASLYEQLLERSIVNCSRCGVMMPYVKAIQDCGHFYCASCYEKEWDDDEEDDQKQTDG